MPVITIEGRMGAGAPEIGQMVAERLRLDFVDRLILADVARRVGATVSAVAEQETRSFSLVDRLAQSVQKVLKRSIVAGMSGDPYFAPGIEHLLARPYYEMDDTPATPSSEVDEKHFIDTTAEVVRDIAESDNVVILSRGGGAILRENPKVLRVGVVGYSETRIRRVMQQRNVSIDQAEELIKHADAAQHRYFEKAFRASPIDPFLYHFMWNTSEVDLAYAARVISDAAENMDEGGLSKVNSDAEDTIQESGE